MTLLITAILLVIGILTALSWKRGWGAWSLVLPIGVLLPTWAGAVVLLPFQVLCVAIGIWMSFLASPPFRFLDRIETWIQTKKKTPGKGPAVAVKTESREGQLPVTPKAEPKVMQPASVAKTEPKDQRPVPVSVPVPVHTLEEEGQELGDEIDHLFDDIHPDTPGSLKHVGG
jgi:hypothetical protein